MQDCLGVFLLLEFHEGLAYQFIGSAVRISDLENFDSGLRNLDVPHDFLRQTSVAILDDSEQEQRCYSTLQEFNRTRC